MRVLHVHGLDCGHVVTPVDHHIAVPPLYASRFSHTPTASTKLGWKYGSNTSVRNSPGFSVRPLISIWMLIDGKGKLLPVFLYVAYDSAEMLVRAVPM